MQGGHRARRLAGQQDTCRRQRTHRCHSLAHSCPVEGHPPGDGPPWGSWACRAHRRLPESPGICPPISRCHLCAQQTLPQRPLAPSTTSHDHLSSHIPPQKNLRTQTQLCPSAVVPFPTAAEKGPLLPLPTAGGEMSSLPGHACWAASGPSTHPALALTQGETATPNQSLLQPSGSTHFSNPGFSPAPLYMRESPAF